MSRVVWLSDIHLDHASEAAIDGLISDLREANADYVLIGGDIGEASSFRGFLTMLAGSAPGHVCFVLGNHDYYRSSIEGVRQVASAICLEDAISWLPQSEVLQLSESTALVGHGGWGDGRIGDVFKSEIYLNDYRLIDELRSIATPGYMTDELVFKLNQLGDEAAAFLRGQATAALENAEHVVVLTHVPPWREACWYQGRISDDNWAPHFTCKAVGDALVGVMESVGPDKRMTVLCGHSHGGGVARILPNLEARTAEAEYGRPGICEIIEL
jgi:predicted phosphohydrolase